MSKRKPLIVAGVIFTIVAIGHLLRLINHWEVIIGGWNIPSSLSVVAVIVGAILAIWMFKSAARD